MRALYGAVLLVAADGIRAGAVEGAHADAGVVEAGQLTLPRQMGLPSDERRGVMLPPLARTYWRPVP